MKGPEERQLYEHLFEQSPIGSFVTDLEGNFLLTNPSLSRFLGYSADELMQMNLMKLCITPKKMILSVNLKNDDATKIQELLKRKDGTHFYASIQLRTLGKNRVQGLLYELEGKKKILENLASSEERFRQLTECVRDVFFLIDLKNHKILYVSPAFEEVWGGLRSNIFVPGKWKKHIHPEDHDHVLALYEKQVHTGYFDGRFRMIQHNGRIRWLHVRTFPVYNAQQQLYRSAGIAEDITDQMLINQERLGHEKALKQNFNEMIVAVVRAQEQKDPYTVGHQNNVAQLSAMIAQELNFSLDKIKGVELAAHVHDIGKIGIPAEILTKPSGLTTIEYELIKIHAEAGYNILQHIHFPWPIAEAVGQHHERMDGSGYPHKLKGEEILIEARIIAVADTVDVMSSHRPYRPARGIDAALAEIQKDQGTLFDTNVVQACIRLFKKNKVNLYQNNK